MLIYYLSDSTVPSAKANSIQVMRMCQAFAAQNANVTLLCRRGDHFDGDVHSFYGVTNSFGIRAISTINMRIVDRLSLALAGLRAFRGLEGAVTVYARDFFLAGIFCFFVPRAHVIVLEVHAPPSNRFWQWWLKKAIGSGRLRLIVAISSALAREYQRIYQELPPHLVHVAHDGASRRAEMTQPSAELPSSTPDPRARLGYVGSLRPGKGMEMIYQLANQMPKIDFHVVGGDVGVVRAWIAQGLPSNLFLHGFVAPAEAESYLSKFDVLLAPYQPSVLVADGNMNISPWMSPLKVFEYMRSGKPILASDLPVLREVLCDGWNALLVNPTSTDDWCAGIERLLGDESLRSGLAATAKLDFEQNYTWEKRAESILNAIANLPKGD